MSTNNIPNNTLPDGTARAVTATYGGERGRHCTPRVPVVGGFLVSCVIVEFV